MEKKNKLGIIGTILGLMLIPTILAENYLNEVAQDIYYGTLLFLSNAFGKFFAFVVIIIIVLIIGAFFLLIKKLITSKQ
jgi:hypothetical protein